MKYLVLLVLLFVSAVGFAKQFNNVGYVDILGLEENYIVIKDFLYVVSSSSKITSRSSSITAFNQLQLGMFVGVNAYKNANGQWEITELHVFPSSYKPTKEDLKYKTME